jgi:hypothetical protein
MALPKPGDGDASCAIRQRIGTRGRMKQRAVRLRDSDALREEARQVVDVLEHVEGTDDIELRVGPCGSVVEGDASDVVDCERASRVCDRAAA